MRLRGGVELLIGFGQLLTLFHPLCHLVAQLVPDLCAACLHKEIALRGRDFWFAWITVHRDEIAGKTREELVDHLTLTAFANLDHFRAAAKMIRSLLPEIRTG
jgi:hypothetical protein